MEQAGFTKLAGTLALKSLLERGMLERIEDVTDRGDTFTALMVTSKGMDWLLANKSKLTLKEPQGITDDDIPF